MRREVLIRYFTMIVLALAVSWWAAPAAADVTKTKKLISGQGGIGAHDGANHFSIDGGTTFAPAFIIAPHPAWGGLPGSKWINFGPTFASLPVLYPQTTIYRTHFNLPATFTAPSLTVTLLADNGATVFLNGNLVGAQSVAGCPFACPGANFTVPTVFVDANPAHFKKGKNIIEFRIVDFGAAAGLDYVATFTYTVDGKGSN